MFDAVVNPLHAVITSVWGYPSLFAIAMLDGVLPVFPAESLVIVAGLYAAAGRPYLPAVVLLAGTGAFAGDHVSYLLGRASGGHVNRWTRRGARRRAAFVWAGRALAERGGVMLVAARYVAGGRNAATVTMGMVGYPLRWFSLYDGVGAASWALFSALLGYLGGVTFQRHPAQGLVFSLSGAVGIAVLAESVRYLRRRRRAAAGRRAAARSEQQRHAEHGQAPAGELSGDLEGARSPGGHAA